MPIEAQRESRGIDATHSQPRRYKVVGSQHKVPASFSPGKTRYALHRELGGPRVRSGRGTKNTASTGM
jgi:hypothetical protein